MSMVWTIVSCKLSVSSLLAFTVVNALMVTFIVAPLWKSGILTGTLTLDYLTSSWNRGILRGLSTMNVDGIIPSLSMVYTVVSRSMSMVWTIVPCKLSVSSSLAFTVVNALMVTIMNVRILKNNREV